MCTGSDVPRTEGSAKDREAAMAALRPASGPAVPCFKSATAASGSETGTASESLAGP
eukprot:CAMPEP_0202835072 /NCGR_PEP_ID=MMETSP1389-20130828/35025_1 /ASSEMBLY_ACC=CAM_ASM_000865 /TAXON_ID=302021 /ORGANISM="Rhodomonas sp., Strain CCMP768" /LENGTH=56 /DNA_ID=CAMNT_0049510451 /DNA_START=211 /DNA_END=377 /DNA_ORIENTATION=+